MDNQEKKVSVAALSVLSNTTLVVLKIIVGLLIGSVSVISEAIHSGVDLLAAVIALFAVKTSSRPADEEHPFGHGKVENISGTVEALLIFVAAGWIIFEAVKKLMSPHLMQEAGWGIAVMAFSALVNFLISSQLFKVGKLTDSVALQADAWHLRTDVYTSIGVMAGLAIIKIGKIVLPGINLNWVDPVAAIIVALLIIKAAYDLVMDSARDLLDNALPAEEVKWLNEYIQGLNPPARGYHKLRTRKSGSDRFVEFHLQVSSDMSVHASHKITQRATKDIRAKFPGAHVTIHIEPCDMECLEKCTLGCMLSKKEREAAKSTEIKKS